MAKGFTLYVDGDEVFKTEDPALRVTVGAEQGELAAFATNEIDNVHINVEYEGVLNRHLHDVERVQKEERRQATAAREEDRGTERAATPARVVSPDTEETQDFPGFSPSAKSSE